MWVEYCELGFLKSTISQVVAAWKGVNTGKSFGQLELASVLGLVDPKQGSAMASRLLATYNSVWLKGRLPK